MTIANEYERYMLDLINAERAAVGAPPLQLEQNLNLAADRHSQWMLQADIFSHTGQGGSSATQRMREAGFDFSGGWRSAENIAVQSERGPDGIMDDVANLHTSLMNSPGHRANILNPDLDYIGIGIDLGDFDFSSGTYESVIVTQNFASTGGTVDLDLGEAPQPVVQAAPAFVVAQVQAPDPVVREDPVAEDAEDVIPEVVTRSPEAEPENAPTPVAEDVPAPEATPTQGSPWAAAFSTDAIAFLDDLFDDFALDIPVADQGPSQSLSDVMQGMVQQQFERLEETFAALQSDELAF